MKMRTQCGKKKNYNIHACCTSHCDNFDMISYHFFFEKPILFISPSPQ